MDNWFSIIFGVISLIKFVYLVYCRWTDTAKELQVLEPLAWLSLSILCHIEYLLEHLQH